MTKLGMAGGRSTWLSFFAIMKNSNMTTQDYYSLPPDEDGWRKLPNGNKFKLGLGCIIGNNVIIGDGVVIGRGNTISHRCIIDNGVVIGDYVTIGYCTMIYESAIIGDRVVIGDNVEVGIRCTVGNAVIVCSSATIEDGDKILHHLSKLAMNKKWASSG